MALSCTLIRTYAAEYLAQPELVLRSTNHRILTDTHADQFVTVFYGILDPTTGTLMYCNAGHQPPVLISDQDSAIRSLPKTGMALGVAGDTTWEQGGAQLEPGDVLVLYTDGITDAENSERAFFGRDRLLESVKASLDSRDSQGASPQDIRDTILEAVSRLVGDTPQFDDIALIILVRDA